MNSLVFLAELTEQQQQVEYAGKAKKLKQYIVESKENDFVYFLYLYCLSKRLGVSKYPIPGKT